MLSQVKQSQPARLVVAVSGSGRSLANFLAWQDKLAAYRVVGVITSSLDCGAIAMARQQQLPIYYQEFKPTNTASPELCSWLAKLETDWIALAGFLKIFPTSFSPSAPWQHQILNIHPSLLPEFSGKSMYGNRVHAAVLKAQRPITGASVHFVNERYDAGRIIAQVKVPVKDDDRVEVLAKRVFAAECYLYPHTLLDLIRGQLPLSESKIYEYPYSSNEK